jgi:lipoprotein-releasing system permease protein
MLDNFPLTVAIKYFKAKKNERIVSVVSAFSFLGVMLGVAALIVVMSVMHGFHIELTKNIIGLNGDINISSVFRSVSTEEYEKIKQTLGNQKYIKHYSPNVVGQALALGTKTNSGVIVRGIDLADLKYKEEILSHVIYGDFANFFGKDAIAIGSELSYSLGVKLGDKLKLISPTAVSTAFGSIPRSKEFKVVAVFASGMYDYDSATVLMPMKAAQVFLSMGDTINLIEVRTTAPDKALLYSNQLQTLLGEEYRTRSWQQSNAQFLNALAVERVAMFTILSLIILVAAFNIISSLFMLVKDKTKDIAILRTIGATQRQIMLIFMINGMFIGLIGTVLGVLLGAGFAYNIDTIRLCLEKLVGFKIFEAALYFLYALPSKLQIEDVCLVAFVSIALCFCSTIYPSYRASRLNPVEAMRYE